MSDFQKFLTTVFAVWSDCNSYTAKLHDAEVISMTLKAQNGIQATISRNYKRREEERTRRELKERKKRSILKKIMGNTVVTQVN